ncbi:MAG: glycine dehydrogenase (aminomethyl-transferring), partial [Vicingaceae bacterium]
DEGTAAAEAMILAYNSRSRAAKKAGSNQFFVSQNCLPQTIDILKTRSTPLEIELIIGDHHSFEFNENDFGVIVQYPDVTGQINDYKEFAEKAHANESIVIVAADLLSLTQLQAPGDWGADVVVGTTQRFGIPMGYGGPHAAYFATKEAFKRSIPGRIAGVTVDAQGNRALRMALQTREQHIKRDKATSNICTAQVLLAVMAGMYAVYHGAEGLQNISGNINELTGKLAGSLDALGYKRVNDSFFDTVTYEVEADIITKINQLAVAKEINFHYSADRISISIGETETIQDVKNIVSLFAEAIETTVDELNEVNGLPQELKRTGAILEFDIFKKYRSESEMMRYIKRLENKDLSLTHSMISLGSCTMKLNAATELI